MFKKGRWHSSITVSKFYMFLLANVINVQDTKIELIVTGEMANMDDNDIPKNPTSLITGFFAFIEHVRQFSPPIILIDTSNTATHFYLGGVTSRPARPINTFVPQVFISPKIMCT